MLGQPLRLLTLAWLFVALVACGAVAPTPTPQFDRYAAADVWRALGTAQLPVSGWQANAHLTGTLIPATWREAQEFTIGDGKAGGGQVYTFADAAKLAAVQQWFAAPPAYSPHVFVHGNVLLRISDFVPAAEAARYAAALDALP